MTVTQILDCAKNNLNAANDTLWSDTELYQKLYLVMLRAARKTLCISSSESQNTVASTATYTAPTTAHEIWRVTYNGRKLQKIDRREYDALNPNSTSSTGSPAYYMVESTTITLYPTPDAVQALNVFFYAIPSAIPTAATTLEVPAKYHDLLITGLTSEMLSKDLGHPLTGYWRGRFETELNEVQSQVRKSRRADRFAHVKLEEDSIVTDLGIV